MGSISPPSASQILAQALEEAKAQYVKSHPKSLAQHEKACEYMPGGNTRTVLHTNPFPFCVRSASSSTITTIDGHVYNDFLGEYTAGIYGHDHPVIKKALEDAISRGWNYGAHSEKEAELAQLICQRFPPMELVRFVNSGTEANMMALATARVVTGGRTKVLVFEKGYHGSTISGRVPDGRPSINLPYDLVIGKYNDIAGARELVERMSQNSLAAILVEPMLGSGGCYLAKNEFLQTLRRLANEQGALLIFDEVMTSRLAYSGLGATFAVKPDLMTVGKWCGGGMSFGAFGGRADIMSLYDPTKGQLEHPGTFNNNVFSMHAGVAGCKLLSKAKLDELNDRGNRLKDSLEVQLSSREILSYDTVPRSPVTNPDRHLPNDPDRPPKIFIKGVGSLLCVHFAGPDRDALQCLFYHHMLNENIYLAARGFIALSIAITDAQTAHFASAFTSFIDKWSDALRW